MEYLAVSRGSDGFGLTPLEVTSAHQVVMGKDAFAFG